MTRRMRRGMTIIEVLVASAISLFAIAAIAGFARLNNTVWRNGLEDSKAQKDVTAALQEIGSRARVARKVILAESGSSKLTVQLPAYDSSGNLLIPLQNGVKVSYYLGSATGSTVVQTGTPVYLWRAFNGVPDTGWTVRGTRGNIALAPNGFLITYHPPTDPQSVKVTITAEPSPTGRTFTSSLELLLRNRALSGG